MFRSSHSRVVGGRWLRQERRIQRGNATSPLPRPTSRHSASHAPDADSHVRGELRRSFRLVSALPRSDYSITERWSYGTDIYETRYDTSEYSAGDDTTKPSTSSQKKRGRTSSHHHESHDRKKQKTHSFTSNGAADECIAFCTRSRTAVKPGGSACVKSPNSVQPQTFNPVPSNHDSTLSSTEANAQFSLNNSESGLLPLDERDFAYSPFSSSTDSDSLDSDCSVYSPKSSRRKGSKRKRSSQSLSSKKSSYLIRGSSKRIKIGKSTVGVTGDTKLFHPDREGDTPQKSVNRYSLRKTNPRHSDQPGN